MARRTTAPATATGASDEALLTDPQGADLFNIGITRFLEIQKTDPDFPAPVWLGPRGKRHVRRELLEYALAKRQRAVA